MFRQEKYDSPNPVVRYLIARFFDRVRAEVARLNPASMLDAGCGEGEMLRRGVVPAGVRPVCTDLRTSALQGVPARDRVQASVLALPFPAAGFDLVTCLEVLEHLNDPAEAVREFGRVARRAMVISVPYEPYFRVGNLLRGNHLGAFGNHPEHVQHWNLRTFQSFLAPHVAEVRVSEAFPWIIACCRPKQL